MMVCLFLLINFALLQMATTKQNLYKFIPEYAKVSYINHNYAEIHKWSFRKFNKSTGAFSLDFTFKIDMDYSFKDHITGFLFANNEFKKTAVDFEIKMCPIFEHLHSFDIGHILQYSNMTLKCPIRKGTYYIHNMVPDAKNFPPLMPAGKWMYKQDLIIKDTLFATLDLIWRVEYLNE